MKEILKESKESHHRDIPDISPSLDVLIGNYEEKPFLINGEGPVPKKYRGKILLYNISDGIEVFVLNPENKKWFCAMIVTGNEFQRDYRAYILKMSGNLSKLGIDSIITNTREGKDHYLENYKKA